MLKTRYHELDRVMTVVIERPDESLVSPASIWGGLVDGGVTVHRKALHRIRKRKAWPPDAIEKSNHLLRDQREKIYSAAKNSLNNVLQLWRGLELVSIEDEVKLLAKDLRTRVTKVMHMSMYCEKCSNS
jgi:hypothetical protein